jgi:hypothetical protein
MYFELNLPFASCASELLSDCSIDPIGIPQLTNMTEESFRLGSAGPTIRSPMGMGLWSWGDAMVRPPAALTAR